MPDSTYPNMCGEVEQELAQPTLECQLGQEFSVERHPVLLLPGLQVMNVVFHDGQGSATASHGE